MQKAAAEEVSKCASLLTYLSEVIVIDRTLLLNCTDLCPSINPNRVPVGNTLRYRRFSSRDGETVLFRARVQTSRAQGNKMVFLNLRQRTDSVQALVTVTPEKISKQMVKWTAGLADESIVLVEGVVKKTPEIIKSASVGDVEVHLSQVRVGYLLTSS